MKTPEEILEEFGADIICDRGTAIKAIESYHAQFEGMESLIERVEGLKYADTEIDCSEDSAYNAGLDQAVNIIKSTPEKVCEWNKLSLSDYYYPSCTECKPYFQSINDITYCPHCGRKIKRT